MNGEEVALALVALDVYHQELSPQYEGLRAQLVGSLATGQATLESLRQQEVEQRANYDLIRSFTDRLPVATPSQFMVADPYIVRQVQANALWLCEPNTWNPREGRNIPYYIVGQRKATPDDYYVKGSAATDLLLSSASSDATKAALRIVTVRDAELAIALHAVQEASFRDFTSEEIARMFDRDSGLLRVDYREGVRTELAQNLPLSEPPRFRDVAKKIAKKGLAVRTAGSYAQCIDDTDLAAFDVFTSLNRLATAFDKKSELAALLETYKNQTSKSTGETGARRIAIPLPDPSQSEASL